MPDGGQLPAPGAMSSHWSRRAIGVQMVLHPGKNYTKAGKYFCQSYGRCRHNALLPDNCAERRLPIMFRLDSALL